MKGHFQRLGYLKNCPMSDELWCPGAFRSQANRFNSFCSRVSRKCLDDIVIIVVVAVAWKQLKSFLLKKKHLFWTSKADKSVLHLQKLHDFYDPGTRAVYNLHNTITIGHWLFMNQYTDEVKSDHQNKCTYYYFLE